ncbi:hypothetical protein BDN70DRAFT_877151 [Pholiota conissans]|uniref:F-box domain-containing protein n=1 Tax=Pholiota conissans TaxID=109636 RepID=A0A9P5Z494_9AGAR|nr:hypothetical protein BDN70DRAFT_877151 [Pholiota conissans]
MASDPRQTEDMFKTISASDGTPAAEAQLRIEQAISQRTVTTVNSLPFEILATIFAECLPPYPLTQIQPNVTIAPMLLCHVCSVWRTVAFACSTLWSHLNVGLPILWSPEGDPVVWNSKEMSDDIDFLRWWKKNQGSRPPFLRLYSRRRGLKMGSQSYQRLSLDEDIANFLLDYMSSAQYLDADIFYRYLIVRSNHRKNPNDLCPNLHTLKTEYSLNVYLQYAMVEDEEPRSDGMAQRFSSLVPVPLPVPPTLRRLHLYINDTGFSCMGRLDRWSALTHLSLSSECNISEWHSISRALLALEWGHFIIVFSEEITGHYIEPPIHRLSALSHLFLHFGSAYGEVLNFPLRALFHNLHMPVLRDLRLSSETSWWSTTASPEILTVLKCTPSLTKLAFEAEDSSFSSDPSTIGTEFAPISRYVPFLAHIQFQIFFPLNDSASILAEQFVKEIFCPREWLHLENSFNTIRKVTIIIENSRPQTSTETFEALLVHAIAKRVKEATHISFEVNTRLYPATMCLLDETLKEWTVA